MNTPPRVVAHEWVLGRDAWAAAGARARVAEALAAVEATEPGGGDLVETAQLLVSELVSNVLLHTDSPARLRLEVEAGVLRVEVLDELPVPPVAGLLDPAAVSGRGLLLVASLATRWGVRPTGGEGKAVWFELRDDQPPPDEAALLDLWDLDGEGRRAEDADDPPRDTSGVPPGAGGAALEAAAEVVVEVPDVRVAAQQATKAHLDDLVRDLALVQRAARERPGAADPHGLVELADRLLALCHRLAGFRAQLRQQTVEAAARAEETVTLRLRVPRDIGPDLEAYERALDEADAHCAAGRLLVDPAPAALAAFRRWKLGLVRTRLADAVARPPAAGPVDRGGRAATACPG